MKILALFCFALALAAAETAFPPASNLPPGVKPLHSPGIHNLFQISSNLFSGSAPEGDAAFAALAKLGVKTIVTVDGAKPDLEHAHKHGLRYVHLPHGYDGISTNTQALLIKAVNSADGSVFMHCHHGKHRGPAAAAVVCLANDYWTKAQAEAWLVAAGTATNYVGLYDTVRQFQPPSPAQLNALPSQFPESVAVSGLVDAMVEIDNHWDLLKAVRAANYQTPKDHPDLKPANEALILREHYREAQRLPDSVAKGTNFLAHLKTAEHETKEAEQLLQKFAATPTAELRGQLDRSFDGLAKTCSTCHKAFRDPSGIKSSK